MIFKKAEESNVTEVDYSLDWQDSPAAINQGNPTNKELIDTMEELRSGLRFCKYQLLYTYSLCRKEVAYKIADELRKIDATLIVRVSKLKENLSFNPSMNCYVRYIIVAKHPKAMAFALKDLKDDLMYPSE